MGIFRTTKKAAAILGLAAAVLLPQTSWAQKTNNPGSGAPPANAQARESVGKGNEWIERLKKGKRSNKPAAAPAATGYYNKYNAAPAAAPAPVMAPFGSVSYVDFDYSKSVSVGGPPVTGMLSDMVDISMWQNSRPAAGLSFNASAAGKIYKVIIGITTPNPNAYIDVDCYVLSGGDLTGNLYIDLIGNEWVSGQGTVTGELYFVSKSAGRHRILLYSHSGDESELSYTVSVEEVNVPMYTALDYSRQITVGGSAQTGTLSGEAFFFVGVMPYAGYSFQATAGKTYEITVDYTAAAEVPMRAGFYVLANGSATGDPERDLLAGDMASNVNNKDTPDGGGGNDGGGNGGLEMELTVKGYFIPGATGSYRIFLGDFERNSLSYSISIKESGLPTYANMSYSPISFVGGIAEANGVLSGPVIAPSRWLVGGGGEAVMAAGHSFNVTAGKKYKVIVEYESDVPVDMRIGFDVLNSGNRVVCDYGTHGQDGKGATLGDRFTAEESGQYRIFLRDENHSLRYAVTIEEVVTYVSLDYFSRPVTVGGLAVTGTLSDMVEIWNMSEPVPAAGLSFTAAAGKTYKITAVFTAADPDDYLDPESFVLPGGNLTGEFYNDRIVGSFGWGSGTATVEMYFTSKNAGQYRILLKDGYNDRQPQLGYSINIEQSVTIPSYADIPYPLIAASGGIAADNGTLSAPAIDPQGRLATAAGGHSFAATAGNAYRITVEYTAGSHIYLQSGFFVLRSGTLAGNPSDEMFRGHGSDNGNGTFTASGAFIPNTSGQFRVLLDATGDFSGLSYSITIEEISITPYNLLAYTSITVGVSVPGTSSGLVNIPGWGRFPAAGHSFTAAAGKTYQISVRYENSDNCAYPTLAVLKGSLTGNFNNDKIEKWDHYNPFCGEMFTAGNSITFDAAGQYRILLWDLHGENLSYTITVSEVKPYTEVDYTPVTVGAPAASGTLSGSVEIPPSPWGTKSLPVAGHIFDVTAGKTYQVTVVYGAGMSGDFDVGYHILTGDGAGIIDVVNEFYYVTDGLTITRNYTPDAAGQYRILLWDWYGGALPYSIRITDVTPGHVCEFSSEKVVTLAATCTHQGEKAYLCQCGEKLGAEPIAIDPLAHSWGGWAVTAPATITSDGVMTRICKHNASHIETDPIPMIPSWLVTVTGGTGGARYAEGAIVTITADAAQHGQKFTGWTISTVTFTGGTNANSSTAKFIMPSAAVTATANYGPVSGVATTDKRVIDNPGKPADAAVVAPVAGALAAEFTVGPNPVLRSAGKVGIFRQGKRVDNGTLSIYDASGNFIRKINIRDAGALRATPNASVSSSSQRRQVGEWDLKDAKGRVVGEGTYVVKGVLKAADGKAEKVSAVFGVR